MMTLILLLIPLIASCIIPFLGKEMIKPFALIASLIQLAATIVAFSSFNNEVAEQFLVDYWWIPSMGISFKAGLDGISILLVALTNVLMPLILLSASTSVIRNPNAFYSLMLFMQFALVGVFAALDAFLFYVFWELALIPIYFICLLWGGADRIRITLKFFIYTLSGSLLMLLGLIYLYLQTPGAHSFDINALYNLQLSAQEQGWLFWAFFLAFAVKIPVFPLHTWQPDTYTDAPAQGTMLLSGIMLKMGIYGIIRWMLPILPSGLEQWSSIATILAVIGIVYASCIAIVQNDFKRLIAYSSIAHVGLITAGVLVMNMEGLQGAMFQMLSHGVYATGLFVITDIIERRTGTREMTKLGGIANENPLFSVLFMIIMLGAVALPLTNGFVGEFLLLNGVFQFNGVTGAFAGLTIILGAVYMLRGYQKIMLGESTEASGKFTRLYLSEKIVLITVAGIVIITGIFPKPLLQVAQPVLEEILAHAKENIG